MRMRMHACMHAYDPCIIHACMHLIHSLVASETDATRVGPDAEGRPVDRETDVAFVVFVVFVVVNDCRWIELSCIDVMSRARAVRESARARVARASRASSSSMTSVTATARVRALARWMIEGGRLARFLLGLDRETDVAFVVFVVFVVVNDCWMTFDSIASTSTRGRRARCVESARARVARASRGNRRRRR